MSYKLWGMAQIQMKIEEEEDDEEEDEDYFKVQKLIRWLQLWLHFYFTEKFNHSQPNVF